MHITRRALSSISFYKSGSNPAASNQNNLSLFKMGLTPRKLFFSSIPFVMSLGFAFYNYSIINKTENRPLDDAKLSDGESKAEQSFSVLMEKQHKIHEMDVDLNKRYDDLSR